MNKDHIEALEVISNRPELFHDDFHGWLETNFHIFAYFEKEALKFAEMGYSKIGAKMLIEQIRYRTKLKELGDGNWKINNSVAPDLSRLFVTLHPQHANLFSFREMVGRGKIVC